MIQLIGITNLNFKIFNILIENIILISIEIFEYFLCALKFKRNKEL